MTPAPPDDARIALIAETYRLLGDPTRLRVLLACLDGPLAVGAIAERTGASQPLVSHHLRLLRGSRLVRGDRQARQVFYQVADAHVSDMLIAMGTHIHEDHSED